MQRLNHERLRWSLALGSDPEMIVCGCKTEREVGLCHSHSRPWLGGTLEQEQHGRIVSSSWSEEGLYKVALCKVGKGPLLIPESFVSETVQIICDKRVYTVKVRLDQVQVWLISVILIRRATTFWGILAGSGNARGLQGCWQWSKSWSEVYTHKNLHTHTHTHTHLYVIFPKTYKTYNIP